jgi:DNA-binding CsgD family transcriptional regulator
MIVGAHRDELGLAHPLLECLAELGRHGTCRRLTLAGLEPLEATELFEELSEGKASALLADQIVSESGGNPFYLGEIAHQLRDEGNIFGVPASVREAVGARVARLSAGTNGVLGLAAAFSRPFAFDVLQSLVDLDEDSLLDALDEALRSRVVVPARDTVDAYEFVHALVRQTLYEEMSPSRQARLHRRIAQAIEVVARGDEERHAAELAMQYHRSRSLPGAERGIRSALTAADQAQRAYAREETVRFLRIARELAMATEDRVQAPILQRLALAEAEAVEIEAACRTVDAALTAMAGAAVPRAAVADFIHAAAWALQDVGAPQDVVEPLASHGLALVAESRELIWARLKLVEQPVERIAAGPIRAGRWLGFDQDAVRIARAHGDEADYAHTLEIMDWRSRQETEELLARTVNWRQPSAKIHALTIVLRDFSRRHGSLRDTERVATLLDEFSQEVGSLPGRAYAAAYRVDLYRDLGDFDRARAHAVEAEHLVSRLGPGHRLAGFETWFRPSADRFVDLDWHAVAEENYAFATASTTPVWMALNIAALAAEAFAFVGETDRAHRLLGWIVPTLPQIAPRTLNQNAVVGLGGSAVWLLEAVEFAAPFRTAALALLAAGVGDMTTSSVELTVARMAALLGDADEADEYFTRARTTLEAAGKRPLRAIVDYEDALARIRAGSGGARPLLEAARAQFESLGMTMWIERADGLAAAAAERLPADLTSREAEVLRLAAAGRSNKQIAAELVLSVHTVERHLANVYRKIGAHNRADATAFAIREAL